MAKAKPLPPLSVLKNLFYYDPKSGNIFLKTNRKGSIAKAGDKAGSIIPIKRKGTKSYIIVRVNRRQLFAHRVAWYLHTGNDPLDFFVDHIDGNGLNNAFDNLRLCTNSENGCNRGATTENKTGLKGVGWHKHSQKWTARIQKNGKKICIGYFPTPELAHMAYCKAAAELHGDFARGA